MAVVSAWSRASIMASQPRTYRINRGGGISSQICLVLFPSPPTTIPTYLVQLTLESGNDVLGNRVGQLLEALVDRGDAAMVRVFFLFGIGAAVGSMSLRHRNTGVAVERGQVREARHYSVACVPVRVVDVLCCLEGDLVSLGHASAAAKSTNRAVLPTPDPSTQCVKILPHACDPKRMSLSLVLYCGPESHVPFLFAHMSFSRETTATSESEGDVYTKCSRSTQNPQPKRSHSQSRHLVPTTTGS